MSSFWRRWYTGMFYASIVLSTISVVIIAINLISNDNPWGWLLLFAGVFLVIGAHALIGALLEMMYNIAALKEKLCDSHDEEDIDVCDNDKSNIIEDDNEEDDDYEILDEPDENGFIPWDCPKCGTRNAGKNQYCSNCGYDIDSIA